MFSDRWRRGTNWVLAGLLGAVVAVSACTKPILNPPGADLGQGWLPTDRQTFYRTGQGSHLIPFDWYKALHQAGSEADFSADQLVRYGYLSDDSPLNTDKLPVGFVVDTRKGANQLGLTCAACHTGEIRYLDKAGAKQVLRVDGAPTGADFQAFLTDLDAAAKTTLNDPARFDAFAHRVLGAGYSTDEAGKLRTKFAAWFAQYDHFMDRSLPKTDAWGPGRLDAFGMIFNRVSAHDLGQEANYAAADAPVSYPFLWNAHFRDKIQWNGAVPNGLYIGALGRNTGEVLGVFADFTPHRIGPNATLFGDNSIDFEGLQTLEEKVAALNPPKWPAAAFGYDQALADKGKAVWVQNCASCHEAKASSTVPGAIQADLWPVGTDPKMADNALRRKAVTGALQGTPILPALPPPTQLLNTPPKLQFFGPQAPTGDVLRTVVLATLTDHLVFHPPLSSNALGRAVVKDGHSNYSADSIRALLNAQLLGAYDPKPAGPAGAAYEARSLEGIWATAPYLHNGSVPNLWELLTPPAQRRPCFDVRGAVFDPKTVGFAAEPGACKPGQFAAGAPGNGNGGHDFGTALLADQKWALIEYIKGLSARRP
jgi:cytochrome c5